MDPEKHRLRAALLLAGFLFARYESDRLTARFAGTLQQPARSLNAVNPGVSVSRTGEAASGPMPSPGIFIHSQTPEKHLRP